MQKHSAVTAECFSLVQSCNVKLFFGRVVRIDFTKPTCDIDKTHLNTTAGVTLTTTCTDNPNISGIGTCESQHKKIKSTQTYTVTDVAGNSNTCSMAVYSQRQERTRSRTCLKNTTEILPIQD